MPALTLPDIGDPAFVLAIIVGFVLLLAISRIPVLRTLARLAVTLALVGMLVFIVAERGSFDPALGRITGALDLDRQRVEGAELRVPMDRDGHFWVEARINGQRQRLLVDSGATVTALSTETAARAGIETSAGLVPIVLRTANGAVRPEAGSIAEMRMGNIVARDLAVVVSPAFDGVNVLGMNFLSRLKSWRVEGRTLIMVPNHPQPAAAEG